MTDDDPRAWSLLADTLEPVEPPSELRARLLAGLQGRERFTPFAAEVSRAFGVEHGLVLDSLRAFGEGKGVLPGLFAGSVMLPVPMLPRPRLLLASMPAAMLVPEHTHSARELTYVLSGLLYENEARSYGPGTLLEIGSGASHRLRVDDGAPCFVAFADERFFGPLG